MDDLVSKIKMLNIEVIDLNYQFYDLMDNEFFNYDKAITERENFLIKEINKRVLEIYNCCYEIQVKLGWGLQDTLDYIEDYYSDQIYDSDDLHENFDDIVLEEDLF